MEILFCINNDSAYLMACGVAITSICENNQDENIHFNIFTDESFAEGQKQSLLSVADHYKQTITFYTLNTSRLQDLPLAGYSRAIYYRLLMTNTLPSSIEKIIYFDCDIVVRKSLKELWNEDIEEYSLGAVKDQLLHNSIFEYNRLKYDYNKGYFNSGVLLINLKKWRHEKVLERFIDFSTHNHELCVYPDQDMLNYLFQDSKKWLPFKYNLLQVAYYRQNLLPLYHGLWSELFDQRISPVVLHYAGNQPWKYGCTHPYKKEWYKYLALTEWNKFHPEVPKKNAQQLYSCYKHKLLVTLGIKETIPEPESKFDSNLPSDLE